MPSELFVSCLGGRTWAVLREDGIVTELRVEDAGQGTPVGWVLKASVSRVLPGIQSAFLDTGMERDGFLHVDDLLLPGEGPAPPVDDESDEPDAGGDESDVTLRPRATPRRIEQLLGAGTELLVQVSRHASETKGARLTSYVTLPGRHLVYLPHIEHRGVSRRIDDPEERARLRAILDELPAAPGGFIVRTAGRGAEPTALRGDAALLVESWERIEQAAARVRAPAVVHRDFDLLLRLLRDLPREGVERIVVDDPEAVERAVEYLRRVEPALAELVRHHPGPRRLLESHGLDVEIERALKPKVWLESGGYVVIEQTEALVSIDVNTGKFVGRRDPDDTVLRTNLEAAHEIARQLRLRDLGGIIVIDFIDMPKASDRRRVIDALQTALRRDRARTKIVGLSELGLLQLTRKRTRPGVETLLTRRCPTCAGQGRVKSPETVAAEAITEVERLLPHLDRPLVRLRARPEVAAAVKLRLQQDTDGSLAGVDVRVEEDLSLAPDGFDVLTW